MRYSWGSKCKFVWFYVSPGRLLDGKVLCSTANKLQQNPNAFSKEEYVPGVLTVPW